MLRLLSLSVFVVFLTSNVLANEAVDLVLKKYNTFENSEHLNRDYTFVKALSFENKQALVIVYGQPEGENKRFYRYLFVDAQDKFLYEISLGSYDMTTQIDRELGNIGKNERLYHLDTYCPSEPNENGVSGWGGHSTLGFFTKQPELESLTQTILEKEVGSNPCPSK